MNTIFFVHEYEGHTRGLRQISVVEFDNLITHFDREQMYFAPETREEYARLNPGDFDSDRVLDMFERFDVLFGIHQDSERDIFLCLGR